MIQFSQEKVGEEAPFVKGEEIVILKSGNSLVPWGTIRCVPFDGSVETLKGLLTF